MTDRRHRSFTAKGTGQQTPVTFDLDGVEFTCRPQVPGTVLLEHARKLMQERTAAQELLAIWPDIMEADEHARFRAYVDHPDNEVHVQVLGEVLRFVLEELAGPPTPPPSPSRPSPPATGGTSPRGSATPTAPTPMPAPSGS